MHKSDFLAAVAALLTVMLASSGANAGKVPSAVCLAPMDSSKPNPQPRDIHYTVIVDNQNNVAKVHAGACIVSDLDGTKDTSVDFSVFDQDGKFINVDSDPLGPLSPTDGSGAGHPKIIVTSATDVVIPMSAVGHLLATALITVHWWECKKTDTDPCAQGPAHTDTFLRDVVLQGPSPARFPRRMRSR